MKPIKITESYIEQLVTQIRTQYTNTNSLSDKFTISVDTSTKLPNDKKPTIYFELTAILKIKELIAYADKEVAWHGIVDYNDELNCYTISDILVFPQEVTAATAVATDAYDMWTMEVPDDQFNRMRLHGHSHVNMGTSPSGVDLTYQEQMLTMIKDFYIFMIMNKRNELHIWLYDVANNVVYDKDDLNVVTDLTGYQSWAMLECTKNVTTRVVTTTKTTYPSYTNAYNPKPIEEKKKPGRPKKTTFDEVNKELHPKNYGKKEKQYNPWDEYYLQMYGMTYEDYKDVYCSDR